MSGPVILVLAGGRASRMGGGDKALRRFGGSTLLDHVLDRLRGQGAPVVLSANGDPARFARFGLPVLPDTVPPDTVPPDTVPSDTVPPDTVPPGGVAEAAGPLAGLLAGMEWARARAGEAAELVSVPSDTPFLPIDLVARLAAARELAGAEVAVAASAGRAHPVVGLWPARLAAALRRALVEERLRRVEAWTARLRVARATYPVLPFDPFLNINTPAELAAAEAWLGLP